MFVIRNLGFTFLGWIGVIVAESLGLWNGVIGRLAFTYGFQHGNDLALIETISFN